MADREQPYDPYIPSGGNASQNNGNQRTAALQAVGSPTPPAGILHRTGAGYRNDAAASSVGHRDRALARQQSQQLRGGTKTAL